MSVFTEEVVVSNTPLTVDGSGVTQPISAVSLPLPNNAAQETGGNLAALTAHQTDGTQKTELYDGTNVIGTVAHPVQITGPVSTTPLAAASSTITQITSTGVNQVLLASNSNRKKAILFFTSGIWSIKLGVGATSTSFTYFSSSANTTIEITTWTGEIDAICTTAGKLVNVTELS